MNVWVSAGGGEGRGDGGGVAVKGVCVFWPPVRGELLSGMRYQSLVLTP